MTRAYPEINADSPKARLLLFCRAVGLASNKEIEKLFDLSNGYFKSSGGGMNTDSICKIIRIYPNLNLNWLICGRGEMFASARDTTSGLMVAEDRRGYGAPVPYKVPVRMYDGPEDFSDNGLSLPAKWYMMEKDMLCGRKDDCLVRICDSSLMPKYAEGEYVQLGRLSSEDLPGAINCKKLIFVKLKGSLPLIRTAAYYMERRDTVILSPLNPDKSTYPDIIAPVTDIEQAYSVENVIHL